LANYGQKHYQKN